MSSDTTQDATLLPGIVVKTEQVIKLDSKALLTIATEYLNDMGYEVVDGDAKTTLNQAGLTISVSESVGDAPKKTRRPRKPRTNTPAKVAELPPSDTVDGNVVIEEEAAKPADVFADSKANAKTVEEIKAEAAVPEGGFDISKLGQEVADVPSADIPATLTETIPEAAPYQFGQ